MEQSRGLEHWTTGGNIQCTKHLAITPSIPLNSAAPSYVPQNEMNSCLSMSAPEQETLYLQKFGLRNLHLFRTQTSTMKSFTKILEG